MGQPMRGPVAVGVDGSPPSLHALELAAAEAVLRAVPLRIVYVREPAEHWASRGLGRPAGADAEEVVDAAYRHAMHRHPRLDIDRRVIDGLPATVLIAQSGAACLIVVGQRGCGGYLGLAAGSACTQVATRGHGPVVVTRGGGPTGAPIAAEAPILLGVDADAPAAEAIEFAFASAELREVALRVVYAWRHQPAADAFAPVGADVAEARGPAERLLAEALAGWSDKHPDVHVDRIAEHTLDPPAAVLAASSGVGLAVVGPHDHNALSHLLLGSVGANLIHHAHCPVVVVHPRPV